MGISGLTSTPIQMTEAHFRVAAYQRELGVAHFLLLHDQARPEDVLDDLVDDVDETFRHIEELVPDTIGGGLSLGEVPPPSEKPHTHALLVADATVGADGFIDLSPVDDVETVFIGKSDDGYSEDTVQHLRVDLQQATAS